MKNRKANLIFLIFTMVIAIGLLLVGFYISKNNDYYKNEADNFKEKADKEFLNNGSSSIYKEYINNYTISKQKIIPNYYKGVYFLAFLIFILGISCYTSIKKNIKLSQNEDRTFSELLLQYLNKNSSEAAKFSTIAESSRKKEQAKKITEGVVEAINETKNPKK